MSKDYLLSIVPKKLCQCFRHDSKISEKINYDLLKMIQKIQSGAVSCPELLGYSAISKTKENIPTAITKNMMCVEG